MLPRERVAAVLAYRAPDVLPCIVLPAPAGFRDHGLKLLELLQECGSDFEEVRAWKLPAPPPREDFDPDGKYHAIKTDEWGTTWEYRIYGVWGHPIAWPLEDMGQLSSYSMPPVAEPTGEALAKAQEAGRQRRQRYYQVGGCGDLFTRMHCLRRFEDVLMDVQDDTAEINRLADRLMERSMAEVRWWLAVGVDAISVGDDFGTRDACFFSRRRFREFFLPRYKEIFVPVKKAGKKVLFHCCGQVWDILEDFREMGIDCIWPQLPCYDMQALAKRCRELGIAVQMHPDRGEMMQQGTRGQVRGYLDRMVETFGTMGGGSFLHVEIDPNFRWETTEALVRWAIEKRREG